MDHISERLTKMADAGKRVLDKEFGERQENKTLALRVYTMMRAVWMDEERKNAEGGER